MSRSSAARGPTGIRARRSRPTRSRSGVPAGEAGSAALNAATLYTPSSGWSRPSASTPIAPSRPSRGGVQEQGNRLAGEGRVPGADDDERRRGLQDADRGRQPRHRASARRLLPHPPDAGQPGPRRVLRRCDDDDVSGSHAGRRRQAADGVLEHGDAAEQNGGLVAPRPAP